MVRWCTYHDHASMRLPTVDSPPVTPHQVLVSHFHPCVRWRGGYAYMVGGTNVGVVVDQKVGDLNAAFFACLVERRLTSLQVHGM